MAPRRVRKGKQRERRTVPQSGRPTVALALGALMIVSIFAGVVLFLIPDEPPVITHEVSAELLSNNHAVMPGEATDFVLIVENRGSHVDTFIVEVESNDGGFDIQIESDFKSVVVSPGVQVPLLVNVISPNSGELYGYLTVHSQDDASATATVRFNVNATATFDSSSALNDTVEVQYAGIRARDGVMFDTNLEWLEQSSYPRVAEMDLPPCGPGENPQNYDCYAPHYDLLCALEIGVPAIEKTLSITGAAPAGFEDCGGMIPGFDVKLVGMKMGQTLAVRIPTEDAYRDEGKLAGEDLILLITLVAIR